MSRTRSAATSYRRVVRMMDRIILAIDNARGPADTAHKMEQEFQLRNLVEQVATLACRRRRKCASSNYAKGQQAYWDSLHPHAKAARTAHLARARR